MPMMAAAAGASAIGGIGAAYLGGQAQKKMQEKALKQQAKTALANNALALGNQANVEEWLTPWATGGMQAGNVLMQALGLQPFTGAGAPGAADAASALSSWAPPDAAAQLEYLLKGSSDVIGPKRTKKIAKMGGTPEQRLAYAKSLLKPGERMAYDNYMAQEAKPPPWSGMQAQGGGAGGPTPQSALEAFKGSINFKFLDDQAQKVIANQWGNDFKSPAAVQAMMEQGINTAHTQAIGPWMQQLAQQQGIGVGTTNNIANAGTNTTAAQMGVASNFGDNASNMYGAQGQNTANMYGAAAGAISDAASMYMYSQRPPAGSGQAPSSYPGTPPYNPQLANSSGNYTNTLSLPGFG